MIDDSQDPEPITAEERAQAAEGELANARSGLCVNCYGSGIKGSLEFIPRRWMPPLTITRSDGSKREQKGRWVGGANGFVSRICTWCGGTGDIRGHVEALTDNLERVVRFWGNGESVEEHLAHLDKMDALELARTDEDRAADEAASERFRDWLEQRRRNEGPENAHSWQAKAEAAEAACVRLVKERDHWAAQYQDMRRRAALEPVTKEPTAKLLSHAAEPLNPTHPDRVDGGK